MIVEIESDRDSVVNSLDFVPLKIDPHKLF